MAQVKSNFDEHYRISKTSELFGIVKQGNQYKIVMGEYLASDKSFNSFEDAERYISKKPYELLVNMTIITIKYENKNKKDVEKQMEENA